SFINCFRAAFPSSLESRPNRRTDASPHRAMKWLSGALTFFNTATVLALITGILAHGLTRPIATFCIVVGLLFGFAAYHLTEPAPLRVRKPKPPPLAPEPKSK